MSIDPDDVPPVLEEVRQRRVGKVVLAYLAMAFAAMELSVSFAPLTAAPDLANRVVLGALVLGFPVTVVLAWTYDITPDGVVRTPDNLSDAPGSPTSRAWLVLTVIGVPVGVALHMLRG